MLLALSISSQNAFAIKPVIDCLTSQLIDPQSIRFYNLKDLKSRIDEISFENPLAAIQTLKTLITAHYFTPVELDHAIKYFTNALNKKGMIQWKLKRRITADGEIAYLLPRRSSEKSIFIKKDGTVFFAYYSNMSASNEGTVQLTLKEIEEPQLFDPAERHSTFNGMKEKIDSWNWSVSLADRQGQGFKPQLHVNALKYHLSRYYRTPSETDELLWYFCKKMKNYVPNNPAHYHIQRFYTVEGYIAFLFPSKSFEKSIFIRKDGSIFYARYLNEPKKNADGKVRLQLVRIEEATQNIVDLFSTE